MGCAELYDLEEERPTSRCSSKVKKWTQVSPEPKSLAKTAENVEKVAVFLAFAVVREGLGLRRLEASACAGSFKTSAKSWRSGAHIELLLNRRFRSLPVHSYTI